MAATPTESSGTIIPTPSLLFEQIPQAITCESLQVSWFYNGPDFLINLVATNIGVSQDDPAPPFTSSSTRQPYTGTDKQRRSIPTGAPNPVPSVTVQIASNVDPTSQEYSWPSVSVSQGWYVINATMSSDEYSCLSSNFFVYTGNDTSCITTIGSSTSASTTPTSITSSSSSSSSSSTPVLAVGGASRVNVGTIAGASIGVIVLLAAVLIAWIFLQRKGKGKRVGTGSSRRWNGLSSVDSRALTSTNPTTYTSSRHQTRSGSIGTVPMGGSEEAAAGAEKISIYGKSNENYSPLDGPGSALAAMPVLKQQSPRSKTASRTYSTSSSTSNDFLPNEIVPPPGRRQSVPDLGKRSIDSSNTYPPTSPVSPHGAKTSNQFTAYNMSRSHSSSTSITHQTSTVATPSQSTSSHVPMHQQRPALSPSPQLDPSSPTSPTSDAAKQGYRNSLGGKKRKPVPAYDPNQDLTPRLLSTPSPAPPSPSPDPINTTTPNGAHYATRSQVGQDNSQPDLVHKSSFGPGGVEGKPLHYLIPDMPMHVKD